MQVLLNNEQMRVIIGVCTHHIKEQSLTRIVVIGLISAASKGKQADEGMILLAAEILEGETDHSHAG